MATHNTETDREAFLNASIPSLVSKLTLEEKFALLAAPNWWNTQHIPRLNIPSLRMSDGPNGVRGSSHFSSEGSQCIPCATALAATFDVEAVEHIGKILAWEAKAKSSVILLAPTCNIQRSPIGGRAFESYSEDPTLSGLITAAYVKGLQSEGVAATIKHFVANDQEHERNAADSIVGPRALREIYLYPFMLAQKHAKPLAYMTAYGRLNGTHCSENQWLLKDLLRREWGFDGLVMSDWNGVYGTYESIVAGLELEMPGPPRWRTSLLLNHCMNAQKILPHHVDERVETLLRFVQKQAKRNPEVVYGDLKERRRESEEDRRFCRRIASEAMVLLKNRDDILPLTPNKVKSIAVMGPNAQVAVISGGGSALLQSTYAITPYDGLVANVPSGIDVKYSVGCFAHKYLPTLESLLTTPDGKRGWTGTFHNYAPDGTITNDVSQFTLNDTRIKLNDFMPKGLTAEWGLKMEGLLTVAETGPFELGLAVAGRAKLWVNGELVIDNWTLQTAGEFFYGEGTNEERAVVNLTAGVPAQVLVEFHCTASDSIKVKRKAQPGLMKGVRLGGCPKVDEEQLIQDAVNVAKSVDAVIFIAGLSADWESEGSDRPTMDLPCRQNEVIARVAAANPRTVVAIQAGSAVTMPWVNDVAGIIQAWYSGNECGNSLADVVYGQVNPSGRLPLTLPVKESDNPAYLSTRNENTKIHYREDLLVGYKHYQARELKPLFPFGFGLSYTTFSLNRVSVKDTTGSIPGESFTLEVTAQVTNTGSIPGSQVVQAYVSYPDLGITHPPQQLRAFAKVHNLKPGESKTALLKLDKYSVAHWDTSRDTWLVAAGTYQIGVGFSCDEVLEEVSVEVKEDLRWIGL